MINPQSRYTQGTAVRMANSAGTYNVSVFRTTPAQFQNFTLYIWKSGDRPDLVAYRELGNSELWWAIFDINPEIIYPLKITPGTVVRIPKGPVMGHGTLLQ